MHAIVQHEFGPAENLRYDEVPDPEPGPGQVGIAVAAATSSTPRSAAA